MIDGAAFRERLAGYGPQKVREMIAEGRFGEDKAPIAADWLRTQEEQPLIVRRWRGEDPSAGYQPTTGDLRYRDAVKANPNLDPFEEAVLLRDLTHEYLSALLSDNTSDRSAGFRAQLEAELSRRGGALAVRANRIALGSLAVAVLALIVSLFAL